MIVYRLFMQIQVFITNAVEIVSGKLPSKLRSILLTCSLLLLATGSIMRHLRGNVKDLIAYNELIAMRWGLLAIILLVVAGINQRIDIKNIKGNRMFWLGWILCYVMILIASFFNEVNKEYFLWAIVSLLLFAPHTIAWSARKDYGSFCLLLSKVVIICVDIFLIVSIIWVSLIREKGPSFRGIVGNANSNGMICAAACTAAIYILFTEKKPMLVSLITFGIALGMIHASNCRTALIAVVFETIVGLIYIFRNDAKENRLKRMKNIAAILLAAVLIASITNVTLKITKSEKFFTYAASETSEEYKSATETNDQLKKLDKILSGRLRIWEQSVRETKFWGNGVLHDPLIEGYEASRYVHNNALEVLYTSGVLAFIGYLIWMLAAIIYIVVIIINRKEYKDEVLLAILAFVSYLVFSSLEIMLFPTRNLIAAMFYLSCGPLVLTSKRGLRNEFD